MSFDIFLQRFPPESLSETAVKEVRAALTRHQFTGPDAFGFYVVTFPDGVGVEFSAKGLDGKSPFGSCAFHVRGLGSYLVAFILEIAKAGDLVILPAMEDFVPIISRPDQGAGGLPKDWPEPVLCESPPELEALLSGGYEGWQRYRDQVAKKA